MAEKIFEVDLERRVDTSLLGWPSRGEAADESTLGGNAQYFDLRGIRWSQVEEMLAREKIYLRRLLAGEVDEDALEEELCEAADQSGEAPLEGLDPGVASAVFALSATGAVPAYSCNGGAFGNHHNSHHPVIAAYVQAKSVPLLLVCASRAKVGIENSGGMVIVYADRISTMYAFAREIYGARTDFNRVKRARAHT